MEQAKRQSKLAKSAKMAGKSFGIRTADEYLTELVHGSFEEFGKQPTSNRTAIACAIFTWHFHDWVWAQYKAQLKTRFGFQRIDEFEYHIFANREDFKVIREIANGSKHFNSDQGEIQSTDFEHGFFQGL